jgi:hypothetical protein
MARSSAAYIPYDLRPSKQIERRILVDFLLAARSTGIPVSPLPYVGMGGIKFIDFIMMHKFLGSKNFTSIEGDGGVIERCKFNKPFGDINVYHGDVSKYIDEFNADAPHIFWLDYDWALSQNVFDDLIDLGSKLAIGSFLIVTVSGEASGPLRKLNDRQRLQYFKETLNDFALDFGENDFSDATIRFTISKMLLAILTYSFRARYPAQFFPAIKLLYKDSTWMATVGGYVGNKPEISALVRISKEHLSFLPKQNNDSFFQIPQFNVTDIERRILDLLVTRKPKERSKVRIVKNLGFDSHFIRQYQNMIRYIPRYFESAW